MINLCKIRFLFAAGALLTSPIVATAQQDVGSFDPGAPPPPTNDQPIEDRSVDFLPTTQTKELDAIPFALKLTSDQWRDVQRKLNELGFDSGHPDGQVGPKTRGALKLWQMSVRQEPTGVLDETQFEKLFASSRSLSVRKSASSLVSEKPLDARTLTELPGISRDAISQMCADKMIRDQIDMAGEACSAAFTTDERLAGWVVNPNRNTQARTTRKTENLINEIFVNDPRFIHYSYRYHPEERQRSEIVDAEGKAVDAPPEKWPSQMIELVSRELENLAHNIDSKWRQKYQEKTEAFADAQSKETRFTQAKNEIESRLKVYLESLRAKEARTQIFFQKIATFEERLLVVAQELRNSAHTAERRGADPVLDRVEKLLSEGYRVTGGVRGVKPIHTDVEELIIDGKSTVRVRIASSVNITQSEKGGISFVQPLKIQQKDTSTSAMDRETDAWFDEAKYIVQQFRLQPVFEDPPENDPDDSPIPLRVEHDNLRVAPISISASFADVCNERLESRQTEHRWKRSVRTRLLKAQASRAPVIDFPDWMFEGLGSPKEPAFERAFLEVVGQACDVHLANQLAREKIEMERMRLQRDIRGVQDCTKKVNFDQLSLFCQMTALKERFGDFADELSNVFPGEMSDHLNEVSAALIKITSLQRRGLRTRGRTEFFKPDGRNDATKLAKAFRRLESPIKFRKCKATAELNSVTNERDFILFSSKGTIDQGQNEPATLLGLKRRLASDLSKRLRRVKQFDISEVENGALVSREASHFYDAGRVKRAYLWPPVRQLFSAGIRAIPEYRMIAAVHVTFKRKSPSIDPCEDQIGDKKNDALDALSNVAEETDQPDPATIAMVTNGGRDEALPSHLGERRPPEVKLFIEQFPGERLLEGEHSRFGMKIGVSASGTLPLDGRLRFDILYDVDNISDRTVMLVEDAQTRALRAPFEMSTTGSPELPLMALEEGDAVFDLAIDLFDDPDYEKTESLHFEIRPEVYPNDVKLRVYGPRSIVFVIQDDDEALDPGSYLTDHQGRRWLFKADDIVKKERGCIAFRKLKQKVLRRNFHLPQGDADCRLLHNLVNSITPEHPLADQLKKIKHNRNSVWFASDGGRLGKVCDVVVGELFDESDTSCNPIVLVEAPAERR